jgi:hypothetical protein
MTTDYKKLAAKAREYARYSRLENNHLDPTEKDLLAYADAIDALIAERGAHAACGDQKHGMVDTIDQLKYEQDTLRAKLAAAVCALKKEHQIVKRLTWTRAQSRGRAAPR